MSHLPERKEKNCLNCGTEVIGKFCHICGQENVEPKESVWHLLNHFINDVTHFDGQFFNSLKLLLTKPGFLSREYMIGRRASYLNPVRMYLFTSAIFFLIFFSLLNNNIDKVKSTVNTADIMKMDSAGFKKLIDKENNGVAISRESLKKKLDSQQEIHFSTRFSFQSKKEYDSLLKTGARKDNWFTKQLIYRDFQLKAEYGTRPDELGKAFVEKFVHTFPQMLFILLPILALILKLLYLKKRDFYYTDHLIFSLHFYIFTFIVMIAIVAINKVAGVMRLNWPGYISATLGFIIFLYFYKSLRNFYHQRRAITLLKSFVILLLLFFTLIILFFFFLFLSLYQI